MSFQVLASRFKTPICHRHDHIVAMIARSEKRILTVGDGDLSFSLALSRALASDASVKVIATTWLTREELAGRYHSADGAPWQTSGTVQVLPGWGCFQFAGFARCLAQWKLSRNASEINWSPRSARNCCTEVRWSSTAWTLATCPLLSLRPLGAPWPLSSTSHIWVASLTMVTSPRAASLDCDYWQVQRVGES